MELKKNIFQEERDIIMTLLFLYRREKNFLKITNAKRHVSVSYKINPVFLG